ncbi:MAG: hypothetical protein M1840_006555 [Geoglossum simile]|nr:MAG: hypothetical protein M1840_006555 [Geoglossum simile]
MSATVHVKNISHLTSDKEVGDFFSFCGKITNVTVTPVSSDPESTKSAAVTFEKDTAAKTALLLDNTQLGPNSVQVTGAAGLDELASGQTSTDTTHRNDGELDQEDKPRSRIIAEYLAHGYVVGDQAAQKAIELDRKHGFSQRFTNALHNFESRYHATEKAKSMDTIYGVTEKANAGWRSLSHYFEKALGTPTGQRVRTFYTESEKQALDIHNEARRLANIRKSEATAGGVSASSDANEKTTCKCGSISERCTCPPGRCGCSGCPKVDLKLVEGTTGKTTCNCAGNADICLCPPGACACIGCAKGDLKLVEGTTDKTTCNCAGNAEICLCSPGACACSGCPKATGEERHGRSACGCGGNAATCSCPPGTCNCGE